jgi:hypothetical protein
MALKPVVSDLSSVAEPLRSLYEQRAGQWVLALDGTPPGFVAEAEHNTLKNQHAEFRDNNRSLNGTVTALQEKLKSFDGLDVDAAKAALANAKALADKGIKGGDDLAAAINAAVTAATAPVVSELKALKDSEAKTKQALATKELEQALTAAGIKAGVDEKALPDYLARGLRTFTLEEGRPVAKAADGTLIRKSGEPITPEQWAADLAAEASHLFKPSSGGGAQGSGGGRPGGDAGIRTIPAGSTLTAQDVNDLAAGKAVREAAAA